MGTLDVVVTVDVGTVVLLDTLLSEDERPIDIELSSSSARFSVFEIYSATPP